MERIALTFSMRSNLHSLKVIQEQLDKTQKSLSTGNKVSSALDNASSYYSSRSLTNRAKDLDVLLDSIGQTIKTISVANLGIEEGISFLEKAKTVAEQALLYYRAKQLDEVDLITKDIVEYEKEGYSVITADMSVDEINALINNVDAKVVLADDLYLIDSLVIDVENVVIDGNGHTITINDISGSGAGIMALAKGVNISNLQLNFTSSSNYISSAIVAMGEDTIVDASKIKINNADACGYGILAMQGALFNIDSTDEINADVKVLGTGLASADDALLYEGEIYTKAIVDQIGEIALLASAANQFYVGNKEGEFGQGEWYLPAMGELMEMYGTDTSVIYGDLCGADGADGNNMRLINDALDVLANKDPYIAEKMQDYYWSSSEGVGSTFWVFNVSNGYRGNDGLSEGAQVRCFKLLKNCFIPSSLNNSDSVPRIGDVMYTDKTWGSANDYDGSKVAVGIICDINADGSVKIVNLKDLTFSSKYMEGNFNADDPYGGLFKYTDHFIAGYMRTNIIDIPDVDGYVGKGGSVIVREHDDGGVLYDKQYHDILTEYNRLIKDTSYQGINLLYGDALTVTLNEIRSHKIVINGVDVRYNALGIEMNNWNDIKSVEKSIDELTKAIAKMREYSCMFGNKSQLVQTRQDFIDALIDILEIGADKLVLADINEETANYLVLQTRQQLAINSLSLASQSTQGVLGLF